MPTPTTASAPLANDLHARLTALILAQIETTDPASWQPPWHGADPMPRNALTARRYRGLNILALWCAAQTHGYADARWATYRQWAALGANVRRCARGSLVLFYRELPHGPGPTTPRDTGRGPADAATDRAPFVARAAYVFNIAQVEPTRLLPAATPASRTAPSGDDAGSPAADTVINTFAAATGAAIRYGGTRACYAPATDTIRLPPRAAFLTPAGYAGTLAHELVHWTGAKHRLARDLTGRFGARAYAAEELVAELGAAFTLAELGLARTPHPDHAAYCASWVPLLRADPRALGHAATQASRATDFLLALAGPTADSGPGPHTSAQTPAQHADDEPSQLHSTASDPAIARTGATTTSRRAA